VTSLTPQPASTPVNELSTCYANFSFLDQFGNPYTPSTVSYRIDAPWYNAQVADWAVFSGTLGPTIQIPITGAQNAKQAEADPLPYPRPRTPKCHTQPPRNSFPSGRPGS
jgi:hypothetical protein